MSPPRGERRVNDEEREVLENAVSTAAANADTGSAGAAPMERGETAVNTGAGSAHDATGAPAVTLKPKQTGERAHAVLDEVERAVVGKRPALELVMLGVLAGGHVLIEDLPGLG